MLSHMVAGLFAVRAPVRGWPAALLLIWSVGLLVSATVPTDPAGVPAMTASAYVHRYASISAFLSLPVGAMLLARRLDPHERWWGMAGRIRPLALASGIGLLAMLYVAFPGDRVLMGLVERLLVGWRSRCSPS